MYNPKFESERLSYRTFELSDIETVCALTTLPEVIRYTGDPQGVTFEQVREILTGNIFEQYQRYGMGRLSVIEKKTNKLIGWCGLKYREEREAVDLGYRYLPEFWGKGYATEAAKRLLRHGFEDLGLTEIFAWADKRNHASIRVLQKIGMTFVCEDNCLGEDAFKYVVSV